MRKVAIGCLLLAAAGIASATPTYEIIATGNTTTGDAVKAEADFTFSTNMLTLTLTNLLVNPSGVSQNITDFSFTVASATSGGTLVSASAPQSINVASDGSFTFAGPVNPVRWSFTPSAGGVFALEGLGVPGAPANSIIGAPNSSNIYSNAGGSIAGNGPHNPFIYESATWVFDITGVSSTTTPTNIIFSFGTQAGTDEFFCNSGGCSAPEPGSWLLLGTGLAGLAFFTWKSSRKRTA